MHGPREGIRYGLRLVKDIHGGQVFPFAITDPSDLYEFQTFYEPFELQGFNRSGQIDYSEMQTERAAPQHVHVESDADVTVYAMSQGDLTSDAFLILPTDALSTDYVVTSYTSDTYIGGLSGEATDSPTAIPVAPHGVECPHKRSIPI